MTTPDSKLPVNGQSIKGMTRGLYATETDADNTRSDQACVQRIECPVVTDGGTAGTAVTETAIVSIPFQYGVRVLGAYFVPPVAITASNTVQATFTLASRNAAGGSVATPVATVATTATAFPGNIAAFAQVPFTLTPANVNVPAGGSLTIAVAKTSTGTAIASATAQCLVVVYFEEL